MMMLPTGKIIVICGITCSGKTYLENSALENFSDELVPLLTVTTRAKRKGEKNGKDGIFVSKSKFEKMQQKGELFFINQLFQDNLYAYREEDLNQCKYGYNLITSVSIEYAQELKKLLGNAYCIYVSPSDASIADSKMREIITDKAERKERRAKSIVDMRFINEHMDYFDYFLTNDYSADAERKFLGIVSEILRS